MPKISTADCKKALVAAWSLTFGENMTNLAGKWARISKSGKKGEPIERLFYHDSLPLQALVVEKDGAITETIIRGFASFDCAEDGSEREQAMAERAQTNEAWKLFETYALFRPSDFLFNVCTDEEAARDGHTWYELYPTRDFGRASADCDMEQLDYIVQRYLPETDGECMEATFASESSPADCEAELLKRGFIKSSTFVATSRRAGGDGDDD